MSQKDRPNATVFQYQVNLLCFDMLDWVGLGFFNSPKKLRSKKHNEILNYIYSRYISPMKAAWRIEELPFSDRSHPIVRSAVHTENR